MFQQCGRANKRHEGEGEGRKGRNVCGEFYNTGRKPRETSPLVSRYTVVYDAHNAGAYEFCGKLIHACTVRDRALRYITPRESNCGRSECE